jgi:putative ABC transport system permease protein
MKKFLLKGIIRDKSRSRLPVIVVTLGVLLTVVLYTWLTGIMSDSLELNAAFNTGHVKIMTRAYKEEANLLPNDLALLETESLISELNQTYPEMDWAERIRFGAIIDVPDENGETKTQGPATGWAIDLLSDHTEEAKRMQIPQSLISGRLPQNPGEILISHQFAQKLAVIPGDVITLLGTTMEGSMAFVNLSIAGTISFGSTALDKGAVIMDINDARKAFEMEDATAEILGFFKKGMYNNEKASEIRDQFNSDFSDPENEFSPVMVSLYDQEGMAEMYTYSKSISGMMLIIFVMAMSVVLWNSGLLGGLRRYREFGIRLAVGESKGHIFRSLLTEAVIIGLIGSLLGTFLGLLFAYYVQTYGINISGFMKNSSMLIPSVIKTNVTATTWYIGFIPGIISVVLGNALAAVGIYKRKTAQLFKELEV